MVSQLLDVTAKLNSANAVVTDVSGWDTATIHAVTPSGTLSLKATNDDGGGNATNATNLAAITAVKLADNTVVSSIAASGLYQVEICGKYLYIGGTSAAATSLLIELKKVC